MSWVMLFTSIKRNHSNCIVIQIMTSMMTEEPLYKSTKAEKVQWKFKSIEMTLIENFTLTLHMWAVNKLQTQA